MQGKIELAESWGKVRDAARKCEEKESFPEVLSLLALLAQKYE